MERWEEIEPGHIRLVNDDISDSEGRLAEVAEPLAEVAEKVAEVAEKVAESVKTGVWRFRKSSQIAAQPAENRSQRVKSHAICGGAVVAALIATNYAAPLLFQATLYIAAILIFQLLDPFDIFSRWLAKQTRVIIAIDGIAIMAMFSAGEITAVLAIPVAWIAITGFVCKAMNRRWIIGNAWLYTEDTTTIIRGLWKDSDKTWQADGKRTCRTLLYELGYSKIDDDILDLFVMPVYELGHLHGLKKQYEEPIEQVEQLQKEYDELSEQFDVLSNDYDAVVLEYKKAKMQSENLKEQMDQRESETELEPDAEEEMRISIRALNAKGNSQRKIAKLLHTTRYQVEKALSEERTVNDS